jgi:hypothetical protein
MILDDGVRVLNTNCCQGLCQIGNGHGLDAQHIIGVEKCLEVLSSEERPLREGIDRTALRVIRRSTLN